MTTASSRKFDKLSTTYNSKLKILNALLLTKNSLLASFLIEDYSFQHIHLYHLILLLRHKESNLQYLQTPQKQKFSSLLSNYLQYHEFVFCHFLCISNNNRVWCLIVKFQKGGDLEMWFKMLSNLSH